MSYVLSYITCIPQVIKTQINSWINPIHSQPAEKKTPSKNGAEASLYTNPQHLGNKIDPNINRSTSIKYKKEQDPEKNNKPFTLLLYKPKSVSGYSPSRSYLEFSPSKRQKTNESDLIYKESSPSKKQKTVEPDSIYSRTATFLLSKVKLLSRISPSKSNQESSPSNKPIKNESDSNLVEIENNQMDIDVTSLKNHKISEHEEKIILKECNHSICISKLENEYEKVSNGTFFGKMNCIDCKTQINMNDYVTDKIYECRKKSIQELEIRFVHDVFESLFECQICASEIMVKEGITISCIHRFCFDCFHDYILSMIENGVITGIKCPADDCEYKLSFYETKGVLQGNELEMFENLITRNYKPKEVNKRIYQCSFCQTLVEINTNTTQYQCIGCKKKFCVTCNFDHTGITCTEYQKNLKLNLEGFNIISCPNCQLNYERDEQGCHFLQCRCGSYFCRLCQKLLQKNDHHGSHYPNGPFLKCINKID